jgi:hypothetical protein
MLINLWVKDKRNGHIHQVGTDVHDSVVFLGGEPRYYNLQNGDGTGVGDAYGYEWVEPPDVDDYVMVTPTELYLNRELIHNDVHKILSGIYTPEEREKIVQNKLKELFPLDDSFGGLADD